MSEWPVTFVRSGQSRSTGCLVYAVVTPFLILTLWLFVTVPIQVLFIGEDPPSKPVLALDLVLLAAISFWAIRRAWREYRSRADAALTIDRDRLTYQAGPHSDVISYADVESIRLIPTGLELACFLRMRDGRTFFVPADIAPFDAVRDFLDETLIRDLVRRMEDRLAAGERIAIREPLSRSLWAIARGVGMLLMTPLLIPNPFRILVGIAVLKGGVLQVRRGWLGLRGGFVLDRWGLVGPAQDASRIAWTVLDREDADGVGITFRASGGRAFGAPMLADDFWPALRWLNVRT